MSLSRFHLLVIGLSALGLSGCAYDDVGGYGGLSAGYGNPYYDGYYGPYDYGGWDYPGYGWYQGYYYPGQGAFVYDRGGRRYAMRQADRDYWMRHHWMQQRQGRSFDRDDRQPRREHFGWRDRGPSERGAVVTGQPPVAGPRAWSPDRRAETRLGQRPLIQGERGWQRGPMDSGRQPHRRGRASAPQANTSHMP